VLAGHSIQRESNAHLDCEVSLQRDKIGNRYITKNNNRKVVVSFEKSFDRSGRAFTSVRVLHFNIFEKYDSNLYCICY